MPEQLSFAGIDAAPQPTDRVFFAIFPDARASARVTARMRQLRGQHGLTGRPLAMERLHVTLFHLGDYVGLPQRVVAAASEAAAAVAFPRFNIVFDRAMSFAGISHSQPFVLRGGDGLAALMEFQRALGAEIKKAGLWRKADAHFTPHVTLLYDSRCVTEQIIEPVSWTVTEFVLVHSLLGRTRHIPLARWLLRG